MSNKLDIIAGVVMGTIAGSIMALGHDQGHEPQRDRHRHPNYRGDPEGAARPDEPTPRPRSTVPNEGTEAGLFLYVA